MGVGVPTGTPPSRRVLHVRGTNERAGGVLGRGLRTCIVRVPPSPVSIGMLLLKALVFSAADLRSDEIGVEWNEEAGRPMHARTKSFEAVVCDDVSTHDRQVKNATTATSPVFFDGGF